MDTPVLRPADISVIIVNYGTADLAIAGAQSVLARHHGGRTVDVHIVDNASPGDDALRLQAAFGGPEHAGRVTLYLEATNHGFGRGNNLVMKALAERSSPPEFVFLLNPDASLQNEAIDILSVFLEQHPEVAVVGAGILRPDGTQVPAAFRFPGLLSETMASLGIGIIVRLLRSPSVALPANQPAGPVDWVTGAGFLLRFPVARQVGFFDPDFFLYYEETEFMWRLRSAGQQIWFLPEARIVHAAGAATGMQGGRHRSKAQPAYWYESWRLFFVKTRGVQTTRMIATLRYLAAGLNVALRRMTGRTPTVPQGFGHDFRKHVLAPLFVGNPLESAADGRRMPTQVVSNISENVEPTTAPPLPRGDTNENPKDIGFWALVAEDFRTHDSDWGSQGFWTLFWHRFGNWRMSVRPKLLRFPLSLIYKLMFKACEILCGIKLSYTVKVGRRVRLDHFGGMILGARAIGSDVILRQNTTLGVASIRDLNAKPVIGDGVQVGAGAVIVGDITIGTGAVIGANAVVSKDVPAGAVMGGIPARLIRMRDAD